MNWRTLFMKLNKGQERIWKVIESELGNESVAGPDHVERMTTRCKSFGTDVGVLVSGALLHDTGVVVDRRKHCEVEKIRAAEILKNTEFPKEKIDVAFHVGEAQSRYGGPDPQTIEARIAQDADALEYGGAIGFIRAVV
jgi:HD superfamily phosphodiesterase